MVHDNPILEQAIAWAVRTGDPLFEDWEEFTLWLEADPAHGAAYDHVTASAADGADALLEAPAVANDPMPMEETARAASNRKWMGWVAGIAAAVLAVFATWQMRDQTYSIETAPGEMRIVQLETGGQVALAGASELLLDRGDPGFAALEQGQALFTIDHDPGQPFRVEIGEDTLVDIGTVFDVKRLPGRFSVAVSEGAVLFNPDAENIRVAPGQLLDVDVSGAAVALSDIAPGRIGEWREGRLTFDNAPLAEVAADLSRTTGLAFTVAPDARPQPVSGSLLVDPVRRDPASLGPLLGVEIAQADGEWVIGAR